MRNGYSLRTLGWAPSERHRLGQSRVRLAILNCRKWAAVDEQEGGGNQVPVWLSLKIVSGNLLQTLLKIG